MHRIAAYSSSKLTFPIVSASRWTPSSALWTLSVYLVVQHVHGNLDRRL